MTESNTSQHLLIKSEPALGGWQVAAHIGRELFTDRYGNILAADAKHFHEFKVPKKKGEDKTPPAVQLYVNPKFSPWQQELSQAIHDGYNIVADAVTSCGKTWAVNLIVAHETFSRDNCTTLIISPNSEVLRETLKDILTKNFKRYRHDTTRMLDTISRNYCTYDERRNPTAQVMIVSADSYVDFITRSVNRDFVNKLQFLVFDEVHLPAVTQSLWWSQFIPHKAQLLVLSATLGDPQHAMQIVSHMQQLQPGRPDKIKLISHNVRPIPLQPLLFRGCDTPTDGLVSKSLERAGRIDCVVNRFDPTVRDIMSLDRAANVPKDREGQHKFGLELVAQNSDKIKEHLEKAIETAVLDATPTNLYNALSYLFSNNMGPVMCFNTTCEATHRMVSQLIAHIASLEHSDPSWREAERIMERIEKESHRTRDDGFAKKADERAMGHSDRSGGRRGDVSINELYGAQRKQAMCALEASRKHEKDLQKGDWNKAAPTDQVKVDIPALMRTMNKWRFPSDMENIPTQNIPQWIQDALSMGIGVYVAGMPTWFRYSVFDSYKEGKLRVLFADSTISVGVNLPIRTVIMCGPVPHTLYLQASGRAGRRGLDNQGYILPMMPRAQIMQYLSTPDPTAHLQMQRAMTHTDLVRLMTPENLERYYVDELKPKYRRMSTVAIRPDFDPKFMPTSAYKNEILECYLKSLSETDQHLTKRQMVQIRTDQLQYHRLTNLLKGLPEASSILMLKLLMSGVLHKFEPTEFIDLMGLFFRRIETDAPSAASAASSTDAADADASYYVPEFKRFPGLLTTLQRYSDEYHIGIDFHRPIHRYFSNFCLRQTLDADKLEHIEAIGDWLYAIRKYAMDVVPGDRKLTGKVTCDRFAVLLHKVDEIYVGAKKHT